MILSTPAPLYEDVEALERLADYVSLMLTDVSYIDAFAVAAIPPGFAAGLPFPTHAAKSVSLSPIALKANLPVPTQKPGSAPSKAIYHN